MKQPILLSRATAVVALVWSVLIPIAVILLSTLFRWFMTGEWRLIPLRGPIVTIIAVLAISPMCGMLVRLKWTSVGVYLWLAAGMIGVLGDCMLNALYAAHRGGLALLCGVLLQLALATLVTGCAIVVKFVFSGYLSGIVNNTAAVVEAIEQFRDSHGEYPQFLSDIVPEGLDCIPRIGTSGNSRLQYSTWISHNGVKEFVLWLDVPIGIGRTHYVYSSQWQDGNGWRWMYENQLPSYANDTIYKRDP